MKPLNKNISNFSEKEKIALVKNTYNAIAKEYVNVFYKDTTDCNYINKFLDDLSGLKVLDAGCGIGRDCKYMQEKGFEAIGIDFAEEIIKEAKNNYNLGNFEVMDISKMSFATDSFDGILFTNTLFYIPKSKINLVFSELSRVLKQGGKMLIILQEGNEEKLVTEPLQKGLYTYMQEYSFEHITSVLNKYGLKVYDYKREIVDDKNCPINKKLVLYVTK